METIELRERATALRVRGHSFQQIADELGISKSYAWKLVNSSDYSDSILRRIEELPRLHLKRLEALFAAVYPKAETGDVQSIHAARGLLEHKERLLGLGRRDGAALKQLRQEYIEALHDVLDLLQESHPEAHEAVLRVIVGEPESEEEEPGRRPRAFATEDADPSLRSLDAGDDAASPACGSEPEADPRPPSDDDEDGDDPDELDGLIF